MISNHYQILKAPMTPSILLMALLRPLVSSPTFPRDLNLLNDDLFQSSEPNLVIDQNIKALLENEVISNLLSQKTFFNLTIHHLEEKYFTEPGMNLLFKNIKSHYLEFGNIPNMKELILSFRDASKSEKDLIRIAVKEVSTPSDINQEMLLKQTEYFIKDAIFSSAIILGADALGEHDHQKKMESFALAEESVKISLNDDLGVSLAEIDKVFDDFIDKPGILPLIKSWDVMLGTGFRPKTLSILAAASGVGKSAALCDFAVKFMQQGQDVVFISLEMSESEVAKRIYSNLYDIDISLIAGVEKQVIKQKYKKIKDDCGELIIKEFPTGSLTALGIEGFLAKLENEKGIDHTARLLDC